MLTFLGARLDDPPEERIAEASSAMTDGIWDAPRWV